MRKGKIISNGVLLQRHEYETVLLLTSLGYNVELVPKNNKQGEHTPDLKIDGLYWEMKAPRGEGKWLMSNTIQRAARQSSSIIVDLRRTKRHQTKCIKELKKEFQSSRSAKRLKIITKSKKFLDYEK